MGDLLKDNSFLSGGLVLVILGGLLAYLRQLPGIIWQQVKDKFITVIYLDKSDIFYMWVENWLASQDYSKRCRNLTVSCFRENDDDSPSNKTSEDGGDHSWKIRVTPAHGHHFFRYKRCPIWMRKEQERMKEGGGMLLGLFESITLTFMTRNRDIIQQFLEEVRDFNAPPQEDRIAVYVPQWGNWHLLSLIHPRPIETVVLADGQLQSIVDDIDLFIKSKPWYVKHAIPYRRGYLLYGPPGNGKSSSVLALASHFRKDVYALSIDYTMTNDRFMELIRDVPPGAVLLMEDVDHVSKHPDNDDGSNKLTRSCLLNALDGIAAPDGRILFMTTNFVDKLDDALVRPGRADIALSLGAPTEAQKDAYLSRFFNDDITISRIKASLDGRNSMADLQSEVIKEVWRSNNSTALLAPEKKGLNTDV